MVHNSNGKKNNLNNFEEQGVISYALSKLINLFFTKWEYKLNVLYPDRDRRRNMLPNRL